MYIFFIKYSFQVQLCCDESLISSKTVWTSEKLELLSSYNSRGDEQGNSFKKQKKIKGPVLEQHALTSGAKISNKDNRLYWPMIPLIECSIKTEHQFLE